MRNTGLKKGARLKAKGTKQALYSKNAQIPDFKACFEIFKFYRSHAPMLVVMHKSVQDRHLGMGGDLDVGRNKTTRRQPGWAFPAIGA
jgi:hypothetical protein